MSQVNYTLVFGPYDGTCALVWYDYMYARRNPGASVFIRSMIERYVELGYTFGFTVAVKDGGVSNIVRHDGDDSPEYMMRHYQLPPTSVDHVIDFRNWDAVNDQRAVDLARLITVSARDESAALPTQVDKRYGIHPVRSKRRHSLEVLPLP